VVDPLDARPRDRYLARVAERLRLADEVEREVIEELAAHIVDATTDLIGEGLTADQAEREALARLGSPDALADDIGKAHRGARRLLAAAGGGLFAAGGGAFRGWFIGIFAITGAFYLLTAGVYLVSRTLHVDVLLGFEDHGYNSAITVLAVGTALWGASQAGLATLARRSHRPVASLRPIVAGIGVVGGVLAIATWTLEQNWASVIAILALPVVAVVATMRVREGSPPSGRRMTWRSLGVALVVVLTPLLLLAGVSTVANTPTSGESESSGASEWSSFEAMWHDSGWDRVGLADTSENPIILDDVIQLNGNVLSVDVSTPAALAGWHDLRLEMWRATWASGPGGPRPDSLLVATPIVDGASRLTASARVDRLPGISGVWGVVTGIAPQGGKYVLAEAYSQVAFRGTVLDWFAAVSR
jgi:hypothetical protein